MRILYNGWIKKKRRSATGVLRNVCPHLHRLFFTVRYNHARRVRREKSVKERKQWKKEKALDPISDS